MAPRQSVQRVREATASREVKAEVPRRVVGSDRGEPRLSAMQKMGVVRKAVAGETQRRLRRVQQIRGRRAVGVVAEGAVLGGGRVLPDPGSNEVLMALRAALRARSDEHASVVMRRMTIDAGQHAFSHRVVGRKVETARDIPMATDAERGRRIEHAKGQVGKLTKLVGLTTVRVVAVGADQPGPLVIPRPVRHTMRALCPVS